MLPVSLSLSLSVGFFEKMFLSQLAHVGRPLALGNAFQAKRFFLHQKTVTDGRAFLDEGSGQEVFFKELLAG